MSELIERIESTLADSIKAIQQPRTPWELKHFTVGQHESEPRAWAQCTLELQQKAVALKRAEIIRRQIQRRIARLEERGTEAAFDKAELLKLDLLEQELAVLGAQREAEALLEIYNSFGRTYTRDELNAAESEYWHRRLLRQATLDVNAMGRIGVGNQDALRMAGIAIPGQPDFIRSVEQRFLESGKVRILVVIPTLIPRATIETDGLQCLQGWTVPGTIERKVLVVDGRPIADAYTEAALTAMSDGADFILTVEDDHLIPAGTFERLYELRQQAGPRTIVGAWYPQRKEPRIGAPIVIRSGNREYLADDGSIHEVASCPMGFTLIPTAVFREIPQPWFVTTGNLTQDSFFSQLAREAGYKLLVDTSCRIKHVDRETGRVYE